MINDFNKLTVVQWLTVLLILYGTWLSHKQYHIMREQHERLIKDVEGKK